jgi:4-carboxymuconolactone decarboxylase
MRVTKPRIEPIPYERLSDPNLAALLPEGIAANVTSTLARHPNALKAFMPWGTHVLFGSTLPRRETEIVVLRTGFLCRSGYEWAQHVIFGKLAGLSAEEIERIKKGADAPGWSPAEAALLKAADALHRDQFIPDPLWGELRSHFSEQQCMDLVFACGQYTLISMALNSFGVQLEDDLTPDPELQAF